MPAEAHYPNCNHEPDRRLNKRYSVCGSLEIETNQGTYQAQPVNLSFSGIQFRAELLPPPGTAAVLKLNIEGFDDAIIADGRILWTRGRFGAAIFIFPQASLVTCIVKLARREREQSRSYTAKRPVPAT